MVFVYLCNKPINVKTYRNINDLYNFLLYVVRKERGVFLTTSESDSVLDNAQMELFTEKIPLWGITDVIHDCLAPFKVRVQFTSDSSGLVTFPDDYEHLFAGVFTVSGSTVNPVTFLLDDWLPDQLTNQLRPVTLSNPNALDTANGFQLYPQSTQTGFYSYLRRPAKPYLATTQVDRVITYDPLKSVQLEFRDTYINNILSRALKFLGINMSEADIEQFAQSQQVQTDQ